MARKGTTTVVEARPPCDLCRLQGKQVEAQFDAKTKMGPWAYMCLAHYKVAGIQLGTGFGQRLFLAHEVEA